MATEHLVLLCPCGDKFAVGTGDRTGPWKVPQPKTFTKSLAAWFDEHEGCSVLRHPARPAIMVSADG